MKVYVKTPVEKELPEERKIYITSMGRMAFKPNDRRWYKKIIVEGEEDIQCSIINPEWWLKEIDLSELMEEFIDGIRSYEHESGHSIHNDERDSKEFVEIYLTEKGYIQL